MAGLIKAEGAKIFDFSMRRRWASLHHAPSNTGLGIFVDE